MPLQVELQKLLNTFNASLWYAFLISSCVAFCVGKLVLCIRRYLIKTESCVVTRHKATKIKYRNLRGFRHRKQKVNWIILPHYINPQPPRLICADDFSSLYKDKEKSSVRFPLLVHQKAWWFQTLDIQLSCLLRDGATWTQSNWKAVAKGWSVNSILQSYCSPDVRSTRTKTE